MRIKALWQWLASHTARALYTYLFFIALAAAFWFVKTMQETYETEVAVPIVLTDMPDDVVLTQPLADTLYVRLRDRGNTLLSLVWRASSHPLQVSFRSLRTSGQIGVVSVDNVAKRLAELLPEAQILGYRPDTLSLAYNRGVCARVPVRLAGNIATTPQYYVLGVHHSPDSVTVYAPQSVIDTLQYVTLYVDGCRRLERDTSFAASLPQSPTTMCVPSQVNVNVDVDLYTEKTLRLPVMGQGLPLGTHLRTFPATVDITFRIGAAHYNSISPNDFALLVPYSELSLSPQATNRWRVHLDSLPQGVSQPRFNPSEVEYLIEYQ